MQSNRHSEIRNDATDLAPGAVANTDLYDLWLNSMLPTVGPSMVTGVISSSSHQIAQRSEIAEELDKDIAIDSERLAEKLMQIGCYELAEIAAQDRR